MHTPGSSGILELSADEEVTRQHCPDEKCTCHYSHGNAWKCSGRGAGFRRGEPGRWARGGLSPRLCVSSLLLGGRSPWKKQVAFRSSLGGSSRNKLFEFSSPSLLSLSLKQRMSVVSPRPQKPPFCAWRQGAAVPTLGEQKGLPRSGPARPLVGWDDTGLGASRGSLGGHKDVRQSLGSVPTPAGPGVASGEHRSGGLTLGPRAPAVRCPGREGTGHCLFPPAGSVEASARGKSCL